MIVTRNIESEIERNVYGCKACLILSMSVLFNNQQIMGKQYHISRQTKEVRKFTKQNISWCAIFNYSSKNFVKLKTVQTMKALENQSQH